jgi:hypothetical protein
MITHPSVGSSSPASRPHLLISTAAGGPALSLAGLRESVESDGVPRELWRQIQTDALAAIDADPLTVFTPLPGRTPGDIGHGNAEYIIVDAAGQRVLKCALAGLLTKDRRFAEAALVQIDCLFDRAAWPEWQDLYHRRQLGFDADLRTGQLCRDLGIAYDWLHSQLDDGERGRILEGIDRCGIQPFLRSVALDPPWLQELSNWTTCIVGGLGICGMGLGPDHVESDRLVERAETVMHSYLKLYGSEGEFNENPSYANASMAPTLFYSTLRCYRRNDSSTPELDILHRHCYWCIYASAPPGHVVSFGDGGPDHPASTSFFPAIAAATRDPILQWYYLGYCHPPRFPVWELVWFDGSLKAEAPTPGRLPLGRAYRDHAALASSRTSWDLDSTACVVFGKGGHGGVIHSHPDAGQVEIHGRGRRLIVDLGKVHYPPGDDRRSYYHFGTDGHNVVTTGGRSLYWERSGDRRSHPVASEFDNARGGWWKIDSTELHHGARRVERLVAHLFPGYVVVVDQIELDIEAEIRLRWHTAATPELGADGCFSVSSDSVILSGAVTAMDAEPSFSLGRHEYRPPLDRDRIGNLLPQRREPYLDCLVRGRRVCLLSLFAVELAGAEQSDWSATADQDSQVWRHENGAAGVEVRVGAEEISVAGSAGSWTLSL